MLAEHPIDAERWAAHLAAGDAEPVRRAFAERGASGPSLAWRPDVEGLPPQPLRFLLAHWMQLKGDAAFPPARAIDPLEMRPALGYIALLDVIDGGADFHYRLFGSVIARVSGFDMTGKRLSAHPASPYIGAFYRAAALAVLRREEPLATVHSPPVAVSTTVWHRLLLPLGDGAGGIGRLLSGIVPVARDGRTIGTG